MSTSGSTTITTNRSKSRSNNYERIYDIPNRDGFSSESYGVTGATGVTGVTGVTACEMINATGVTLNPQAALSIIDVSDSNIIDWATHVGGANGEVGTSVAFDSLDNLYAAGLSTSPSVLEFNADNLTAAADIFLPGVTPPTIEAYLIKYDPTGLILWTTRVTGVISAGNDRLAVTTDPSNNVYLAGSGSTGVGFFSANNFSVNPNINLSTTTIGNSFLAKYNSTGTLQWAISTASPGNNNDVKTDSTGYVYVTGYIPNPTVNLSFFDITSQTTPVGGLIFTNTLNAYLAKYSPFGNLVWFTTVGDTNDVFPSNLAIDQNDNVYLTGAYFATPLQVNGPSLPGPTGTLGATGVFTIAKFDSAYDAFVIKYSSSGQPLLATHASGTDVAYGNGVGVDGAGNVYWSVVSDTASVVKFFSAGNTSTTANLIAASPTTAGSFVQYVAQLNSSFIPQWVARVTNLGPGDFFNAEYRFSLTADPNGNTYVTGAYSIPNAQIYNSNNTTLTPDFTLPNAGSYDVYVLKFNSSGILQWATRIAGASGELAYSITISPLGSIATTGAYSSNFVDIYEPIEATGSTGTIVLPNSNLSGSDAYIVKYAVPEVILPNGTTCGETKIIVSTDSTFGLNIVSNGIVIATTSQNIGAIKLVWTGTQWIVLSSNGFV